MKYTKERLSEMSDLEINKAIVEKFKGKYDGDCGGSAYFIDKATGRSESFHFVSWEQIMPLAVEYKIGLEWVVDVFGVYSRNAWVCHESPQRAIACCLLMMDLE